MNTGFGSSFILPPLCHHPLGSSLHFSPKKVSTYAQKRAEKVLFRRALSVETHARTGQLTAAHTGLVYVRPLFEGLLNPLTFTKT